MVKIRDSWGRNIKIRRKKYTDLKRENENITIERNKRNHIEYNRNTVK